MPAIDQAQSSQREGAVARLRAATRPCHDAVDTAYSVFDLADRVHYGRFLLAHAEATGAAEASLAGSHDLTPWRPRMALLTDDLDRLGLALPPALAFGRAEVDAWRWGVLYVLEGSRLGATLLVKRAGSQVPSAYLSSRHLAGEWRSLLMAIDARGSAGGEAWIEAAIDGARNCFALYQSAARDMMP
jgi:heme oxygenase